MSNASYIDKAISGDVEKTDPHPDFNQCPICHTWILKSAPHCISCGHIFSQLDEWDKNHATK